MSDTIDPYLPPDSFSHPSDGSALLNSTPTQPLRSIVIGWEKLRISYNIALFVLGAPILFMAPESLKLCIFVGIMANVCYFVGPLLELYFCALLMREPSRFVRLLLFALGMTVTLAELGLGYLAADVVA